MHHDRLSGDLRIDPLRAAERGPLLADVAAPDEPGSPAYATVVLDVDAAVSGVDGIGWLAERRGPEVARAVAEVTARADRGELPQARAYAERLARIRPTRADADALARAYLDSLAPGCAEAVRRLRRAGVQVVLVSGGLRHSLLPLALALDLSPADLHAVSVQFDALGAYAGFDASSPLVGGDGTREVIARLRLDGPVLAVGAGPADLAMRDAADTFAAFTGFVRRDAVVRDADLELASFAELLPVVLPGPPA